MVVQEGNIRKTMAARGLVNGRGPRSGRDLVFRCYPPELLFTPPKKTEADLLGQPLGVAWTFSPMCDVSADPRWGRVSEGSGEDPYLGAKMSAAMVEGYQGKDLADSSTILVFVTNNCKICEK